jgi:hypothetical protein
MHADQQTFTGPNTVRACITANRWCILLTMNTVVYIPLQKAVGSAYAPNSPVSVAWVLASAVGASQLLPPPIDISHS